MNRLFSKPLSPWVAIALAASTGSAIAADPIAQTTPSAECCIKKNPKKPLEYRQLVYPLCFYDTDQGAVANAQKFWQTYPKKVEEIVSSQSKYADVIVSTSRNVFINATMYRHKRIAKVWPEIACIGLSGGNESSSMQRICKSYIKEYLELSISGKNTDEISTKPICQTFLSSDIN